MLIYKATEVVNFAQGDLLMLGAFVGWTLIVPLGLPYVVAFILTLAIMALVGAGSTASSCARSSASRISPASC